MKNLGASTSAKLRRVLLRQIKAQERCEEIVTTATNASGI